MDRYIKKILNIVIKTLLIFFISIALFLIFDFLFGNFLINKYLYKIKDSNFYQKKFRIPHPVFHHTLAPYISYTKMDWGNEKYYICTDQFGFKSKCENKNVTKFDLVFIGDSFTEGIGYRYEDTFIGIIDNKVKLSTANMGVTSYSPKIYLSKIKYYLENKIEFKHLVVFLDISDLDDDRNFYKLTKNFRVIDKRVDKRIERFFRTNFYLTSQLKSIFFDKKTKIEKKSEDKKFLETLEFHRSSWTYSNSQSNDLFYNNKEQAIDEILNTMFDLYKLLKENNIKLSIAVYPWPDQILNDKVYSKQVTLWEEFCKNKCANFINYFPIFMSDSNNIGIKKNTIKKYYIQNDSHFNDEGHKLIADYFIKNFNF
jgi:hypothetical protein